MSQEIAGPSRRGPGAKYANSPIAEAACEFRFIPGEPWDATVTGLIYSGLRRKYPERRTVPHLEAAVTAGPFRLEGQLTPTMRSQFASRDGRSIVSVGPDLLSVSRLRPYTGWPTFRPMIDDALGRYTRVAKPKGFHRIGLRYINRIVIPDSEHGGSLEMLRFFDIGPHMGPGFPESYGGFGLVVHFNYHGGRDVLRVQLHTFVDDPAPNAATVDLDLDYFLAEPGSVPQGREMEWVEEAHRKIEDAFEASIKDTLRKLFGQEGEG